MKIIFRIGRYNEENESYDDRDDDESYEEDDEQSI